MVGESRASARRRPLVVAHDHGLVVVVGIVRRLAGRGVRAVADVGVAGDVPPVRREQPFSVGHHVTVQDQLESGDEVHDLKHHDRGVRRRIRDCPAVVVGDRQSVARRVRPGGGERAAVRANRSGGRRSAKTRAVELSARPSDRNPPPTPPPTGSDQTRPGTDRSARRARSDREASADPRAHSDDP